MKREKKNGEYLELRDYAVKAVRAWDSGDITCDIILNGILIYGVRVVEGEKGDFLGWPSRKGSDGKYYKHVYAPLSPEDHAAILNAIEEKLNE